MEKPVPKEGQVLIKVEASVINPLDLISMRSGPGTSTKVLGGEGSGTVVATGKRVGFFSGDGAWGEYVAINAD